MPRPSCRSSRNRRHQVWRVSLLALGAFAASCKPAPKPAEQNPPALAANNELLKQLTAARLDAAKSKLEQHRPDEALALLVSALYADPASEETRLAAESILKETVWNLPVLTLDHAMPIEQIAFTAPSSLWVSLGGKTNTTVRWNLDALRIESVLFPVKNCKTRSLIFDETRRRVVIERDAVTLLCDAQTLKPIRELGGLPDSLTPSAVTVFSRDGLLAAHPAFVSDKDRSIIWHLRDAATGEILRSTEPAPNAAPPLAAYLDRHQLRVLHGDGSLLEIPVSPTEEIHRTALPEPVKLLQAQFAADGNSVLALQDQGPHEPPVQSVISYRDGDDGSLEPEALALRFPWSRQPTLWSGLLKNADDAPFSVDGNIVKLLTNKHTDIVAGSPITAIAFDEDQVLTGDENGDLTFHRLLPLPTSRPGAGKPAALHPSALTALSNLCEALAASRYDAKERTFTRLSPEARLQAFRACDLDAIHAIFPTLDFTEIRTAFTTPRIPEPTALHPLHDRLAQAEPINAPPGLVETFRSNDSPAILSAIQSAGEKGHAAATALALALDSDHPEWIEASLAAVKDLPPLLRQLSLSRIAWLHGRKADALNGWPEVFPDLTEVKRREDWAGWEQADFKPSLDHLRECVRGELAAIEVPENSTPEQRKALAARLADPATVAAVGRHRFAAACLKAATAFSAFKEETESTFQLASRAREMGAPVEPCLRAEALALTALGDYQKAHPRWIELITEHPVETTVPADYAEAAYTAFETADPRQAMEILTTGMHRFPQDADFALRAGWVALLTGNSDRAYRFLREGKRIGFQPEKLEKATALLAIAAAQSGAPDDAAVYFQDLLKLNPAWAEPATVEALDWPEEMKSVFGQLGH